MKDNKMTQKKHLPGLFILTLIFLLVLSACGGQEEEQVVDPNAAITQVVETAMAALTETAKVQTPTPSLTPTVLPTNTPVPTMQPSPTVATLVSLPTTSSSSPGFTQPSGSTSSCDIGGFVKDVTIPDGTNMTPGQSFTKTWEIKNNGTCTWNENYTIVFYGGEQMASATTFKFTQDDVEPGENTTFKFTQDDVEPGENVQISVDMKAPTKAGEFISYWILRNDLGQNFFVGGSSIYVEIIVGTATLTPTTNVPTATPNPWPTLTITAGPTSGTAGTSLTFSATATDAKDGTITDDIVWTTSDSQSDTGGSVSFTFATAGNYTVTASITDSDGNTSTRQVTVTIN
jgi:hypothetical protein